MQIIRPTDGHWRVFRQILSDGQATAKLVTEAHLAALAIITSYIDLRSLHQETLYALEEMLEPTK